MNNRILSRRRFLQQGLTVVAACSLPPLDQPAAPKTVMTVNGPVSVDKLGFTLSHEHILVDFAGAGKVSKSNYNEDEVYAKALPVLLAAKEKGCSTIAECTPAYLGRDVQLLKRLSIASGLHIITNTGYYGAAKEKHIPSHAYLESASEIAARWISEWKNGIGDSGIKPGFIKSGVDNFPLSTVQQKLVEAAALTHLETGLTIGIHTGDGKAAMEEMRIIIAAGANPSSWIWIHAQNEKDKAYHLKAAQAGGWVSFDGYSKNLTESYVQFLLDMKNAGYLQNVLISHDAGWYHVGEPGGGNYRAYNEIKEYLLPALETSDFTRKELEQIFVINPGRALSVGVRRV